MCGIFAIYNKKSEKNTMELINGMKRLQHRGRDGFGVVRYSRKVGYQEYREKGEVKDCDDDEKKKNSKSQSCVFDKRSFMLSQMSRSMSLQSLIKVMPLGVLVLNG